MVSGLRGRSTRRHRRFYHVTGTPASRGVDDSGSQPRGSRAERSHHGEPWEREARRGTARSHARPSQKLRTRQSQRRRAQRPKQDGVVSRCFLRDAGHLSTSVRRCAREEHRSQLGARLRPRVWKTDTSLHEGRHSLLLVIFLTFHCDLFSVSLLFFISMAKLGRHPLVELLKDSGSGRGQAGSRSAPERTKPRRMLSVKPVGTTAQCVPGGPSRGCEAERPALLVRRPQGG